jgi:hypothetical protein
MRAPRIPALSELYDQLTMCVGAPYETVQLACGPVWRYRWRSSVISVLFAAGRSVALHIAYPDSSSDARLLAAALFRRKATARQTKLYVGVTGALLVGATCPPSALQALDTSARDGRPLVVRECHELRNA